MKFNRVIGKHLENLFDVWRVGASALTKEKRAVAVAPCSKFHKIIAQRKVYVNLNKCQVVTQHSETKIPIVTHTK